MTPLVAFLAGLLVAGLLGAAIAGWAAFFWTKRQNASVSSQPQVVPPEQPVQTPPSFPPAPEQPVQTPLLSTPTSESPLQQEDSETEPTSEAEAVESAEVPPAEPPVDVPSGEPEDLVLDPPESASELTISLPEPAAPEPVSELPASSEVAPTPKGPTETILAVPQEPAPFQPRPTLISNPTTIALLNEWPCSIAGSENGPTILIAEPAWPAMVAGKAAVNQVLAADEEGMPVLYLLPVLQPDEHLIRRHCFPLSPRVGHCHMLRDLAQSRCINLQFVFWEPELGWVSAFTKQVSFELEIAQVALERFETWLNVNEQASDEVVLRRRQQPYPAMIPFVEKLTPLLSEREDRADAIAVLFNHFVPAAVRPALKVLKELTWEESLEVEPYLRNIALWYVTEILQEVAVCKRKGPLAVMKSVLAYTRDPRVVDIALQDEALLAELGFDVIPLCSWPGHLERLLHLSRHSQRFYRSLAARSLSAVILLTAVKQEDRGRAVARLMEMSARDRSKVVRGECAALLKTDSEAFWAEVRPKRVQPIGL